jgi:hypothetical protein
MDEDKRPRRDHRRHRITVRLTESERQKLGEEAARFGITTSDAIRRLIREHILIDRSSNP